jgi:[DsrC]-trisulfide reductase subunit M
MNVNYLSSLVAVIILGIIAYVGAQSGGFYQALFGIWIPYAAVALFIIGFVNRVLGWARSPVPFRIPSTCGQQKSLDWIKQSRIDNPSSTIGVVIRMFFEIVLFRSLFRNTRVEIKGEKLSYKWVMWLWLFAITFHYSFLVVVLRHLRFFTDPIPFFVPLIEKVDGILQIGLPILYISGVTLLSGAILLLLRRALIPKLNYISQAADYFPLFLIIGIASTGIMMRYFTKVDVIHVKELTMGLVTLHPGIPAGGISGLFYVHLFLVSILVAYIPFSKIMHMGGVFLSPSRNLANNSRAKRHINPWNYPVKVHTYEEYEDDFREKMIEAGLPVEKE